jgi:DNA polymerase-3 subunit delta'
VFLLVSHSPGRLLPTIRSRCRLLRFGRLGQAEMLSVLTRGVPEADEAERESLADVGDGSPGRALRYAGLDVAGLDAALSSLITGGDPSNAIRARLARDLAGKPAQARYAAFLDRAVSLSAEVAKNRAGLALVDALDAHAAARDLAGAAIGLSLDPATTVFEMAGILAGLARTAA